MAEHLFSETNSLENSKGFKKNPKASVIIEGSIIRRADSYGCRDLSCLGILDANWPIQILLIWHTWVLRCAHRVKFSFDN